MSTTTTDPIEAAHSLLAEFEARGHKPALWLLDAFTLQQVKDRASGSGAYLYPSTTPHALFLNLPYKLGRNGMELLTREAARAAGHIV